MRAQRLDRALRKRGRAHAQHSLPGQECSPASRLMTQVAPRRTLGGMTACMLQTISQVSRHLSRHLTSRATEGALLLCTGAGATHGMSSAGARAPRRSRTLPVAACTARKPTHASIARRPAHAHHRITGPPSCIVRLTRFASTPNALRHACKVHRRKKPGNHAERRRLHVRSRALPVRRRAARHASVAAARTVLNLLQLQ